MDSEQEIFEGMYTQVESSQWRANDEIQIRKRQFGVECPYDERSPQKKPALPEDASPSQGSHMAIMAKLDAIQKVQDQLIAKLDSVENRQLDVGEKVAQIQGVISDKMPERGEVQAQSKLLRECRVLTARVQQSVSRITGDMESAESTELAAMIPMSSVELKIFNVHKFTTLQDS